MILERHKIGDIHPYDMLTTKMHPKFIATKLFPKSLLGSGHLLSVFDRIILNSCICQRISRFPSHSF